MASANQPPLFDWLRARGAGVLLHPTCFPGDFGIGTFGREARQFIDFLHEAGFTFWQLCPLGPTGYGDSPYQGPSAIAGNPYLIDLIAVVDAGLVRPDLLGPLLFLPQDRVDFGGIYRLKRPVLRQAFEHFRHNRRMALPYGDFEKFKSRHASWLEPYALFQALKDGFDGRAWTEWPEECGSYGSARASAWPGKLALEIESHMFTQYLCHGQWRELRGYANERGISIVGDIPIFVALDSADVWANPEYFQMERRERQPSAVAGCPPDYFSADGQLWGNPLYDWTALKAENYRWWMDRLRACFELYDVLRIDHFRGFESYWSIPAGSPTARTGHWVEGPGLDFFRTVKAVFPEARIIAEDLGEITPAVEELLRQTGLPGMAVLQFAFGGAADNYYLPHNLKHNQVLYPGTHDNDTTRGWYAAADPGIQDHVRRYFRINGQETGWDFIRACYGAVSRLAVIPLQDLLSLGSEGRFNTPGRPTGNWTWRYTQPQLDALRRNSTDYLRELGGLYGRLPIAPEPADGG